jgi:FAD/FMN-containing dehydrogenase
VRVQGRLALGAYCIETQPAITSAALQQARECAAAASAFIEVAGGASIDWPERAGPTTNDVQLMRELKQQFDPAGLLEPAIRLFT